MHLLSNDTSVTFVEASMRCDAMLHAQIKSKIELDYTTTHMYVASTVVARSVSYPSSISRIHHHQHHQYNQATMNERERERERD